jgi:hypothetical protein
MAIHTTTIQQGTMGVTVAPPTKRVIVTHLPQFWILFTQLRPIVHHTVDEERLSGRKGH